MNTNIKRRVKRIRLSPGDFLYPLFEAITNAIDAIEEKGEEEGEVKIEVFRGEDEAVKKFIVRDNGIGFTNQNYKSFHEDGTEHKAEKGGLGEGRFTMLKAFKSVKIKSVYSDKSGIFEKKFSFTNTETDKTETRKLPEKESTGSTVTLENYLEEFKKNSKCGTLDIAVGIVEHFLVYFLTDKMPTVTIEDKCEQGSIGDTSQHDLQKIFEKYFSSNRSYDLKEEDSLRVYLVEMPADMPRLPHSRKQHKLNLCAHGRKVKSENLSALVTNFVEPIKNTALVTNLVEPIKNTAESTSYYLSAYLEGEYLNKHVNSWRDNFDFPEPDGEEEANPSLEEIKKLVKEKIEERYKDCIEEIEKAKAEGIINFIRKNAVEYNYLCDHPEKFKEIPPGSKEDKINEYLHKADCQVGKEIKEEYKKLKEKGGSMEAEKYCEELKKVLKKVNGPAKSRLADYVVKRKIVIDTFGDITKKYVDETEEYAKEAVVHNLIFPMKKDSKEVSYNNHNLWLLDERLAFHTHIASDKKNKAVVDGGSDGRPDLLIYDKFHKFSSNDGQCESVVVFEFKQPNKKVLVEQCCEQVHKYLGDLKGKTTKKEHGQVLEITDETLMYGYLICMTDKNQKENLIDRGYQKTPYGALRFVSGTRCIEVLSYEYLLKSVNDRHRAFFKELGIET